MITAPPQRAPRVIMRRSLPRPVTRSFAPTVVEEWHRLTAVPVGVVRSLDGRIDRVPHGSITFDTLRQYVVGDESWIHLLDSPKALHDERRANEQHQGERYFGNSESVA